MDRFNEMHSYILEDSNNSLSKVLSELHSGFCFKKPNDNNHGCPLFRKGVKEGIVAI